MKAFFYMFPYLLGVWFIFIILSSSCPLCMLILILFFIISAVKKYKKLSSKSNHIHIGAINIGLLPLLLINYAMTPLLFNNGELNEGAIIASVVIYSPILYIGSLIILLILSYFYRLFKYNKTLRL